MLYFSRFLSFLGSEGVSKLLYICITLLCSVLHFISTLSGKNYMKNKKVQIKSTEIHKKQPRSVADYNETWLLFLVNILQ